MQRLFSQNISGNIQGTSGNIQGTIREHSGNIQVELSPHPNCKKHFEKVPNLTQNTTCPHEYPRQGLTRPSDVSQE
jgi:hypothetical protein